MMNKLTEAIVLRRQPTPSLLIEILSLLYFFIQHIGIWQVMKENTIPVLLVHGTADSNVPVEMTIQAAKNCIAPKKLLLVEGAEHGTGYLVDNAGYVQALQEFCCVSSAERY